MNRYAIKPVNAVGSFVDGLDHGLDRQRFMQENERRKKAEARRVKSEKWAEEDREYTVNTLRPRQEEDRQNTLARNKVLEGRQDAQHAQQQWLWDQQKGDKLFNDQVSVASEAVYKLHPQARTTALNGIKDPKVAAAVRKNMATAVDRELKMRESIMARQESDAMDVFSTPLGEWQHMSAYLKENYPNDFQNTNLEAKTPEELVKVKHAILLKFSSAYKQMEIQKDLMQKYSGSTGTEEQRKQYDTAYRGYIKDNEGATEEEAATYAASIANWSPGSKEAPEPDPAIANVIAELSQGGNSGDAVAKETLPNNSIVPPTESVPQNDVAQQVPVTQNTVAPPTESEEPANSLWSKISDKASDVIARMDESNQQANVKAAKAAGVRDLKKKFKQKKHETEMAYELRLKEINSKMDKIRETNKKQPHESDEQYYMRIERIAMGEGVFKPEDRWN